MKRTNKNTQKDRKGIVMSLSDVYEVTFTKNTTYHKKGDKKLVSLPIAMKLSDQGKVKLDEATTQKVKELKEGIKEVTEKEAAKA
ncbi:hypothetical protein GGR21_002469 [Dysgonomonas hofstadii]|uniref:Uncharacterized protein n=1 Tax=Dysgonomonas hofstadii TaxID=637886 RepID=A0A840CXF0_9BACT|nr:hypothetical protein [Dysgonomonas hofstadii]MBB4036563.1 hypothetical protein [Dysgonomonas hofstadii]